MNWEDSVVVDAGQLWSSNDTALKWTQHSRNLSSASLDTSKVYR